MFFTIEALQAKKGDALLIHYGTPNNPTLLVVDGGPAGVYRHSLEKRLTALRDLRAPDGSLPVRLLMVSHIDDDHIHGVLELTAKLKEAKEAHEMPLCSIDTLWHNSFDDVVGDHADNFLAGAQERMGPAAFNGELHFDLNLKNPDSPLILASVPQGRTLRDNARFLGLEVNAPFDGVVTGSEDGAPIEPSWADGLEAIVVGPSRKRLLEFQEEWDKELKRRGLDKPAEVDVAAYLDESVYNLASIVVLLRAEDKEILLTGDARGDDVLEGLEQAGLLEPGGTRRLDVLKCPHHGSDRNVEAEFFRRLPAEHYVFSGDGSHGNPEPNTFQMLFEGRRGDDKPFVIHLTYPPEQYRPDHGEDYPLAELNAILDEQQNAGRAFKINTPTDGNVSLAVDLLDPFEI